MNPATHRLKSGDVVEVRSFTEIAATLDADGACDGVPFMAEMRQYCGRRFRVFKRADKICMETEYYLDLRRMPEAVTLESVRCDGGAHDDCRRMCMIFWKECWLKPVEGATPEPPIDWRSILEKRDAQPKPPLDPDKVYSCQATALPRSTQPLRLWDARHYARDLSSGAVRARDMPKVLFMVTYNKLAHVVGGSDYGMVRGKQARTPVIQLGLKPGERVRIKRREQVAATLDAAGRNRGLYFGNQEAARHCGKTYPVLARFDRMIVEHSGKMRVINNTVLLEGTECSGQCFRGCARGGYPMWREAWLERPAEQPRPEPQREPSRLEAPYGEQTALVTRTT